MSENKIVKAYCSKTDRYFVLELKRALLGWKVTNFVPVSKEEGRMITSEVSQSSFKTADNLQACPKCGNRKIGGCSCATRESCPAPQDGLISCAYCSHLRVDYSAAVYDTSSHRPGDVIRLSQGQTVKLSAAAGKKLEQIKVKCGWDPAVQGYSMDVDTSIFVLGGQQCEVVYYGDLTHPSGCVEHHGDDLTGGKGEIIDVKFKKVPRDRDKIIFVINIYECAARGQRLGDVRNMYISLQDPDSQRPLVEYHELGNMTNATALVIGIAYREGQEWFFKAEGRASYAKNIRELQQECISRYGR